MMIERLQTVADLMDEALRSGVDVVDVYREWEAARATSD